MVGPGPVPPACPRRLDLPANISPSEVSPYVRGGISSAREEALKAIGDDETLTIEQIKSKMKKRRGQMYECDDTWVLEDWFSLAMPG